MTSIYAQSEQIWRNTRYWTEEVDTLYKTYMPLLTATYRKYSIAKTTAPRHVNLDLFRNLVSDIGLLEDESIVDRDLPIIFNLAMMTQVDEVNSSSHLEMSFVEFLELLARLAEKISLKPLGLNIPDNIPAEVLRAQPLQVKLESLFGLIFHRCFDRLAQDAIGIPSGSPIISLSTSKGVGRSRAMRQSSMQPIPKTPRTPQTDANLKNGITKLPVTPRIRISQSSITE
eukprot:TRINITY_DN8770_c0_g2_i1.p1 TRINITY_DN8770_c0_g2~~TRINITY_DN8770_c0_g2_i1.p1  ORF type:complete len:229 (-),score=33.00 TRINITY_DN8770_c0_g2_i1:93-779(-)